MRTRSTLAALATFALGLCLVTPAARAEDKAEAPKENPQYTYWAKHKAGSSVTLEGKMDAGGQQATMTMKATLAEIGKDSVTVEQSVTMNVAGQVMSPPARKEVVSATPKAGETIKEVGTEEVTIAGKALKCKVLEVSSNANGVEATSKIWVNEEIPGGVAKMVVKAGPQEITVTTTSYESKQ
jgi:hypothetical protein